MILMLLSLCFQADSGSESKVLAESRFEIRRFGLRLLEEEAVVLLGNSEAPLVFPLSYDGELRPGMTLEALLVGPSLAAPLAVQSDAERMALFVEREHLTAVGSYRLIQVRLSAQGQVLERAQPDEAVIHVLDELFLSQVELRELSREELLQRGYLFSPKDYKAFQFRLALALDERREYVDVEVLLPHPENPVKLPHQQISNPFNRFLKLRYFSWGGRGDLPFLEMDSRGASYQPDGLLLVPGQFHYLKSHFGVTALLLNTSPSGLGVRMERLKSRVVLPSAMPGGLPLELGSNQSASQAMINAGPDGQLGSADDGDAIAAGERASSETILLGNLEGAWPVEVELSGDLILPQGREAFKASAQADVFVRDADFTLTLEHPEAVAEGEGYPLHLHLTNTSEVVLAGFSVTLDPFKLSGVELAAGQNPVLGPVDIPPGAELTLTYNMKALISGRVVSSYFKAGPGQALELRVGVGEDGEEHTGIAFHFPPVFYNLPASITPGLKRMARKAMDFSQMGAHELPAALSPIRASAVRQHNRHMAQVGQSMAYGLPAKEALAELWALHLGGNQPYLPLDQLRRHLEENLGLTAAFAGEWAAHFDGQPVEEWLTFLSRQIDGAPAVVALAVQADQPFALELRDGSGHLHDLAGERGIPFASLLDLGQNRALFWLQDAQATPSAELRLAQAGHVSVAALFPGPNGRLLAFHSAQQVEQLAVDLHPEGQEMGVQIGGSRRSVAASLVAPKPMELAWMRQVDPTLGIRGDLYGRQLMFHFSNRLDLSSLDPIEERVWINGRSASSAVLQPDGRTLLVAAPVSLGPYRPIRYELRGVRDIHGQSLPHLEGSFTGSPWYLGVTIQGRVVDAGNEVSGAKAYLLDPHGNPVQLEEVSADGAFQFDFFPLTLPKKEGKALEQEAARFKVEVLLPDGRYKGQTFHPQAAGQNVLAEFSFARRGRVEGTLYLAGAPVPLSPVFLRHLGDASRNQQVTTDELGRFAFEDCEVGPIALTAAPNGHFAQSSGYLTAGNSPLRLDLYGHAPTGGIAGLLSRQQQGETVPLQGAYVGFARYGDQVPYVEIGDLALPAQVLAQSDVDGRFQLDAVPAGTGQLFILHHLTGLKTWDLQVHEAEITPFDYSFNGSEVLRFGGVVRGRVLRGAQGVAGLLVKGAGGSANWTDALGRYELRGLPLNQTTQLLIEEDRRIVMVHSLTIPADPGYLLDQDILLTEDEPTPIYGLLLDAEGHPIPYCPLYDSSDPWNAVKLRSVAETNYRGEFTILERGKGKNHIYSAMLPPRIASREVFVGNDPIHGLVIQQWSHADIQLNLVDGAGQPVLAYAVLKSMFPKPIHDGYGKPVGPDITHQLLSDAQGQALLNGVNCGPIELYGIHPQLGETQHYLANLEPQPDGTPFAITLAFAGNETADLFGSVYDSEGQPVGSGVKVQVSFDSLKAMVQTNEAGQYAFEGLLPTQLSEPKRVEVDVYNPLNQQFAHGELVLSQEINLRKDFILSGRGSLEVRVEDHEGGAVEFAQVDVVWFDLEWTEKGPVGPTLEWVPMVRTAQITPSQPTVNFADLAAGALSVKVSTGNGLVGLREFSLPAGQTPHPLLVRLEAASTIEGVFVDGLGNGIGHAEIALSRSSVLISQLLSSAEPDLQGNFRFDQLPMRSYQLEGTDPATARKAHAEVSTSPQQSQVFVQLALDPVGHLAGTVYEQGQPVVGALLRLRGRNIDWEGGSNGEGHFSFPNLPLGTYVLQGRKNQLFAEGEVTVALTEADQTVTVELHFEPAHELRVTLLSSLGAAVPGAEIRLERLMGYGGGVLLVYADTRFTAADGQVSFSGVRPGEYSLHSYDAGQDLTTRDAFRLFPHNPDPKIIVLHQPGFGEVFGRVVRSDGQPPDERVSVRIGQNAGAVTDQQGHFLATRVPLGAAQRVQVYDPLTRQHALASVSLLEPGQAVELNITLKSTSSVSGRVLRSDGSPLAYASPRMTHPFSLSGLANYQGEFNLEPVPEGPFTLWVRDPQTGRELSRSGEIVLDGQNQPVPAVLDLIFSEDATLEGLVTLSDGTPVRFGEVSAQPTLGGPPLTTFIQGNGLYRLPHLELGGYRIYAQDQSLRVQSPDQTIFLSNGGVTQQHDITFPTSYVLSGLLRQQDGVQPASGGTVELWKTAGNGQVLVYFGESDADGRYSIPHIYPGPYQLKAYDAARAAAVEQAWVMPHQDATLDLVVQDTAILLGSASDGQAPFSAGLVQVSQNGVTRTTQLDQGGTFQVADLRPGWVEVLIQVQQGWIVLQGGVTLVAGSNAYALQSGPCVTLEGQAYLIRQPATHIQPRIAFNGIWRSVPVNASGDFSLPQVPANSEFLLELQYGSRKRQWVVHSGGTDTQLGLFVLDLTPPQIQFQQAGQTLSQWPFPLQIELIEGDAGSTIDPTASRVWVNGLDISSHFQNQGSLLSADWSALPPGFAFAANQLRLEAANDSQSIAQAEFNLNIALAEYALWAHLLDETGSPSAGTLSLDDQPGLTSDGSMLVFPGLAGGPHRLKGWNSSLAARRVVLLDQVPSPSLALPLAEHGAYQGRVLDPMGAPLAQVRMDWENGLSPLDWEFSDASGAWNFPFLPLAAHSFSAQHGDLLGWLEAPALTANGQLLSGLDILMEESGSVEVLVTDDDGLTPIPDCSVQLQLPGLPPSFARAGSTGSDGRVILPRVFRRDLSLSATDPISGRQGFQSASWQQGQSSLSIHIQLAPAGDVQGILQALDGTPLAATQVQFQGPRNLVVESAADGSFLARGLPYGAYSLLVERQDLLQYSASTLTVDQDTLDLGTLRLVQDNPPLLQALNLPGGLDPMLPLSLALNGSDDRALSSWQLELGSLLFQGSLNGTSVQELLNIDLPDDLPAASYPCTFTLRDHWDQASSWQGQLNILYDDQPPVISFQQPQEGATFFELGRVDVQATVLDALNLAEVRLEVPQLGLSSTGNAHPPNYYFRFYLPQVSENTPLTLQIHARDGRGNQSLLERSVQITPLTTEGMPEVRLFAPLPELLLPLSLPQGLQLQIAFSAHDPDRLGGAAFSVEGQVVREWTFGQVDRLIEESWRVPEELRGQPELNCLLEVWDMGGQVWSQTMILHDISGEVRTAANPLVLAPEQSHGDERYILAGGTHIIDGRNALASLVLVNGAVLTQSPTDENEFHLAHSHLQISDAWVVDYRCRLDADGKGFHALPAALGISAGHSSHAGLGYGGSPQECYGSALRPTLPGSYGGGGSWRLTAPTGWLLGEIRADGKRLSSPIQGSGGSIWLESEVLHGLGRVSACGFDRLEQTPDTTSTSTHFGGGGRIALHAPFAGQVQAYGSRLSGAGTIFWNIPQNPRHLQLSNYPYSTPLGQLVTPPRATPLASPLRLVLGQDAQFQEFSQDGHLYQSLEWSAAGLPWLGLDGWVVRKEGTTTLVEAHQLRQSGTIILVSPADQPFGALVPGDVVEITPAFDLLSIGQNAAALAASLASQQLSMGDAGWLMADPSLDLRGPSCAYQGVSHLWGDFLFDQFLPQGEVRLHGSLSADTIAVEAAAQFNAENHLNASFQLQARLIDVQGEIRAPRSGEAQVSGAADASCHGGLGEGNQTFGSLYRPISSGKGTHWGGGHLHLQASERITLAGVVSATPELVFSGRAAGGSILIEAPTIEGAGQLIASGAGSLRGGGGRIALLCQIYGFTGSLTTHAGSNQTSTPGTVFIQSAELPNGKLIVDNGGFIPLRSHGTPLPGLGYRTAQQETGGSQISGLDFPDSLAGLYVVVPGHAPALIRSNSADQLLPQDSFPSLPAGTLYHGLHRLDVLEVRGKAHVVSLDPIEILQQLVLEDGTLDAPLLFADQALLIQGTAGRLNAPLEAGDLVLNGGSLSLNQGGTLQNLQLVGGHALSYGAPLTLQSALLENSTLLSASTQGLVVQGDLRLHGSTWTVVDRVPGTPLPQIAAQVGGTLAVDATSKVSTGLENKGPDQAFEWPLGTPYSGKSHGGFNSLSLNGSTSTEQGVYGRFDFPRTPGGRWGGGIVHLQAARLELEGSIDADAEPNGDGAAGSLLIEAGEILGAGTLSSRPSYLTAAGGRIAIHYQGSPAFRQSLSILTARSGSAMSHNSAYGYGGAGTVFFKGPEHNHGELWIDQSPRPGHAARQRLTGIPGHRELLLSQEEQSPANQLGDPSWQLAPDLAGQWLELELQGQTHRLQVLENTFNTLQLNGELPKPLPAGTRILFVLPLDKLTLRGGALLHYPGILELAELNADPDRSKSSGLWCRDLRGLPEPFALQQARLLLALSDPSWQQRDVVLDQADLDLALPLALRDLTMTAATIRHAPVNLQHAHSWLFQPTLDLQLRHLTMDAASSLTASRAVYSSTARGNYAAHGGLASQSRGPAYGSFYQPDEYGNGQYLYSGGRIRLRADSASNLTVLCEGGTGSSGGSGGSIWLEVGQLQGTTLLKANGHRDGSTSAGGGRIAVHAAQAEDIQTQTYGYTGSAGSAFLRIGAGLGTLRVVNDRATAVPTPIPGPAAFAAPSGFTLQSQGADTLLFLPGISCSDNLAGLFLVPRGELTARVRVVQSQNLPGGLQLLLEGGWAALAVGDLLEFRLLVDQLQLQFAQLSGDVPVQELDAQAPQLTSWQITPFYGGKLDSGQPFTLSFSGQDNQEVHHAEVVFAGQTQVLQGAGPFTSALTAPVVSAPEQHPLTLRLFDDFGNAGEEPLLLEVLPPDGEAPQLTILQPQDQAHIAMDADFQLRLQVLDNRFVQRLSALFDGHQQLLEPVGNEPEERVFSFHTPLLATPESRLLEVLAEDPFGNQTQQTLTIHLISPGSGPSVTLLQPAGSTVRASSTFSAQAEASAPAGIAAVHFLFAGQTVVDDTAPFEAQLNAPAVSAITAYPLVVEAHDNQGQMVSLIHSLNAIPDGFATPELLFLQPGPSAELELGSTLVLSLQMRDLYENAQSPRDSWTSQSVSGSASADWAIHSVPTFPGGLAWRSSGTYCNKRLLSPSFVVQTGSRLRFLHQYALSASASAALLLRQESGSEINLSAQVLLGGPVAPASHWSQSIPEPRWVEVDLSPFSGQLVHLVWQLNNPGGGSSSWAIDEISVARPGGPAHAAGSGILTVQGLGDERQLDDSLTYHHLDLGQQLAGEILARATDDEGRSWLARQSVQSVPDQTPPFLALEEPAPQTLLSTTTPFDLVIQPVAADAAALNQDLLLGGLWQVSHSLNRPVESPALPLGLAFSSASFSQDQELTLHCGPLQLAEFAPLLELHHQPAWSQVLARVELQPEGSSEWLDLAPALLAGPYNHTVLDAGHPWLGLAAWTPGAYQSTLDLSPWANSRVTLRFRIRAAAYTGAQWRFDAAQLKGAMPGSLPLQLLQAQFLGQSQQQTQPPFAFTFPVASQPVTHAARLELVARDAAGLEQSLSVPLILLAGVFTSFSELQLEEGDLSLEGQNLVLEAGSHRIEGAHSLGSLVLQAGAMLSHSPAPDALSPTGMDLDLQGSFVLMPGATLDLDGKGYPQGVSHPAASAPYGHGGWAADQQGGDYGDAYSPFTLGSCAGGGRLRVQAADIAVNGQIRAGGSQQNGRFGAGGSISLTASGSLSGSGSILANGFSGTPGENAGGGGRIALLAGDSSAFLATLQASGGSHAGAGTIYMQSPQRHQLIVASAPSSTGWTPLRATPPAGCSLKLEGSRAFSEHDWAGRPLLLNQAWLRFDSAQRVDLRSRLTHQAARIQGKLQLNAADMDLEAGLELAGDILTDHLEIPEYLSLGLAGVVQASHLELAGTLQVPDDLVDAPLELRLAQQANIQGSGLISAHNGRGARGNLFAHGGPVATFDDAGLATPLPELPVGSFSHPTLPGYGSGALALHAASILLEGRIDVANPNSEGGAETGASGGSCYLETALFQGFGSIDASGGTVEVWDPQFLATPGSGGRIAVKVTAANGYQFQGYLRVEGGRSWNYGQASGAPGTVYLQDPQLWPLGLLRIPCESPWWLGYPHTAASLQGLGARSAQQADLDENGLLNVGAADYPFDLQGRTLRRDTTLTPITDNDQGTLSSDQNFPPFALGDAYIGHLALSRLELAWDFNSLDEIETETFLHEQGSYSIANFTPPKRQTLGKGQSSACSQTFAGCEELELKGHQLSWNGPLRLGKLTLRDGASLNLSEGSHTLQVEELLLENSSLLWRGTLQARSVRLAQGASLSHPIMESRGAGLTVEASSFIMEEGAVIDLNGKGPSSPDARPSHGGLASGSTLTDLYDSPAWPSQPGAGFAPGGQIAIHAFTLHLGGRIQADGSGFSSGGSILLQTSLLSGQGSVSARGGEEQMAGETLRGGGGRIALHFQHLNGFHPDLDTGELPRHAGTVWLEEAPKQLALLASAIHGEKRQTSFLALPPAWSVPATMVETSWQTNQGSALVLPAAQAGPELKMLMLRLGDQRARIVDVLPLPGERVALLLDAPLELDPTHSLSAFIALYNAEELRLQPQSMPVEGAR
jgi:hypothetical protein